MQRHSPRQRELFVPLLAVAVAATGVLNLWSALLADGPRRALVLHDVVHMPMVIEHGSRTVIAVFGLCLLMLARSLAKRKRQAWHLTVLVIAPSPFLHFAKGLDWEEAMICVALLVGLLTHRRSFYAENDPPSARQGIIAAAACFAFAAVYGPVGFLLLRSQFHPRVTLTRAIVQSTYLMVNDPEQPVLSPATHRAQWFEDTLLLISAFAISYGVYMLLRPVLPRGVIEERERREARRLLQLWGGPPLAYFDLLPDKRYLFGPPSVYTGHPPVLDDSHPDARWCVAYRVVGTCAIALGDPLGDPNQARHAILAFIDLCRRNDWLPAFYQVTSRHTDVFRMAGMKLFKIGEDAVIDLTSFSLKGKSFQDLRTAINKMTRAGIVFEECSTRNIPDDDTMTQLAEITEDWLGAHHGEEKGFAMGQFAPGTDSFTDSRLFLARDSGTHSVLAFVTFVPIFGGVDAPGPTGNSSGWGLDLMRRRTSAPNGIMDFLIASAAGRLQCEGAQVVSLGLSPLAGSDDEDAVDGGEWLDRLRALLFERFNHYYHFKGLNSFKAKFAPEWEPRYMVFPRAAHLPTVAYAVVRAHASRRIRYLLGFRPRAAHPLPTRPCPDTLGSPNGQV
ncbi:MAG: bifunctional lysylphosphatidylglycerol flippase/synthetase MprF [Capsulimonadaceae bacterium]